MICTISLPSFEGPLDLLLYLVEQHELDIYQVNVADVAQQYLAHLRAMEELDLDLASEFYLMAVRLLAIKARSLLPVSAIMRGSDGIEADAADDPQRALIRELIAYRQSRDQAAVLAGLAAEQARRYGRSPVTGLDEQSPRLEGDAAPSPVTLADLYSASLARSLRRRPRVITADGMSLRQRMAQVLQVLRRADGMLFTVLQRAAASRREVVLTFLAVLELMRRRRVSVHQPSLFADFSIALARRGRGGTDLGQ